MYDQKISFRVNKVLEESKAKGLKINDISTILKIGKHKRSDLKDTLFRMVKEGRISYKNGKYSASRSNEEYVKGTFDARSLAKNRSYAFVNTPEGDIFVSSEDTLNAYDGDIVEAKLKNKDDQRKFGIITRIIERKRSKFVGTLQFYGKKVYLLPDNTRIHTNFKVDKTGNATDNDKVVLNITNWGNKEYNALPSGNVIEVLGPSGNPQVEIMSVIKHYELPLEFPEKVLAETSNILEVDYDKVLDKRIDYREIRTITIDPISAKDYDDAISLEKNDMGLILYVHIADVADYVKKDSELFSEAVNRGNSYYFPKKVIPMLPEKISNKLCSLRPWEEKLTVTVVTQFNADYEIRDQQVHESIIKSDVRLNYEQVDRLFEGGDHDIEDSIAGMLFEMKKLSSALSQKRIAAGYLSFNLPETEFIFDEDGYITDLKRSSETESHKLIENFMLIANEFIARKLSKHTTIYRIHELPDEERVENLKKILQKYDCKIPKDNNLNIVFQKILADLNSKDMHRVFDKMILRSLKRARYSVENFGHFGLALDTYTHFTSPIRRLSDLIVHHQVKDMISSRGNQFSDQELFDFAEAASDREKIADDAEREVEFKDKITFMKKKLGEEYEGIIVSIRSTAIIVELDKYPVTGLIELSTLKDDYYEFLDEYKQLIGKRKGKIFKLADKLKVNISKVSDDIYLQLIQ
ncbi:MAG: hypothetical protein APR54_05880 [Candidatus Cloacimonas sp. SDB]|nr:MAG: hypothetical protein APR54_05880 [Candidatus Cloacimonas sp. SDB]